MQLATGLVVDDDTQALRRANAAGYIASVDDDSIRPTYALTDRCRTAVYLDAARTYPFLDLSARPQAVLGKHLVKSLFQL